MGNYGLVVLFAIYSEGELQGNKTFSAPSLHEEFKISPPTTELTLAKFDEVDKAINFYKYIQILTLSSMDMVPKVNIKRTRRASTWANSTSYVRDGQAMKHTINDETASMLHRVGGASQRHATDVFMITQRSNLGPCRIYNVRTHYYNILRQL